MNDKMEPFVQFSPFAGKLTALTVPGETSREVEHENDISAADGQDRTMFCYAPVSGCPDAKQNQVLFVLRDGSSEESAQALMESLKLDKLAEEEHFLLLFPNPGKNGWNYREDAGQDNDIDYLIRCFGILRGSPLKVNGFNGMLYYIAATPAASAMMAVMAARRPACVSAMLTVDVPQDFTMPEDSLGVEVAAWCRPGVVADYVAKANGCKEITCDTVLPGKNPECRLVISEKALTAETVLEAWDKLFVPSRRWQNDTYGSYQHRTAFSDRGFTAHVGESCLGVNDGFKHTWFEYIPPQLRGSAEKVPLVFYFHGVNCVPLYGAEQSNLHDIADRENFIVVYPAPAKFKAWNIFNLPNLVSDFDFIMALIEHMKQVHPIDERRIYATGFSMGGMMTHAITAAYPNVFAAGAPCNAFAWARFKTPAEMLPMFLRMSPEELGTVSYSTKLADEAKAAHPEYRMPIFQNAGFIDKDIGVWPVNGNLDDARGKSLRYWKEYNDISTENELDDTTVTGLAADETVLMDKAGRFTKQTWYAKDTGLPMLELVVAQRMPHAIDPIQMEWAWEFIRRFARNADGSLSVLK